MQNFQCTIKTSLSVSGIGLHSAQAVCITLYPAKENSGIIFRRIDLSPAVEIPVTPENVGETALCTTLVKNGVRISTIEHLMSAIAGMGIDNLRIDIDGSEVPILDGSASTFIFLLQSTGVEVQQEMKKFVRILKEVKVRREEDDSWAKLLPYDGFKLTFKIDFDYLKKTEEREFSVDFTSTSYLKEMSRARTFGFLKDSEYLRKNNLALGGSVNNAVVIGDDGIINDGGLRSQNELVKHKTLDAVGDLFALQYPIIGEFQGYKSGHFLNNQLLRTLLKQVDCWETVSFNLPSQLPINYIDSKVG
jgi:UDP-3-O-[3-hydroxymyristoyl] N-acetylglucosamine deacetylase